MKFFRKQEKKPITQKEIDKLKLGYESSKYYFWLQYSH